MIFVNKWQWENIQGQTDCDRRNVIVLIFQFLKCHFFYELVRKAYVKQHEAWWPDGLDKIRWKK